MLIFITLLSYFKIDILITLSLKNLRNTKSLFKKIASLRKDFSEEFIKIAYSTENKYFNSLLYIIFGIYTFTDGNF